MEDGIYAVSAQTVANKLASIFLDAGFSLNEHDYNLSTKLDDRYEIVAWLLFAIF
ncbi:hypothetical protein CCACVL1_08561 [Corchorus capsularis]|uniref:Uncharacterized protein n=1 Tax=Corchorus capsularis TaxID=210143 RepID=A0A1R3IZT7_COCAP|nr:hypothetical protein CCACVL1_08561 [Corchorus capsularis]